MAPTHYELLGIRKDATDEQLIEAYDAKISKVSSFEVRLLTQEYMECCCLDWVHAAGLPPQLPPAACSVL